MDEIMKEAEEQVKEHAKKKPKVYMDNSDEQKTAIIAHVRTQQIRKRQDARTWKRLRRLSLYETKSELDKAIDLAPRLTHSTTESMKPFSSQTTKKACFRFEQPNPFTNCKEDG